MATSDGAQIIGEREELRVPLESEIKELCESYQKQIASLDSCWTFLVADQDRLARLKQKGASPDIGILEACLELREREFEEGRRRMNLTELTLEEKVGRAAYLNQRASCELASRSDEKLRCLMRAQQRIIESQQREIELIESEKQKLWEERQRLGQELQHGPRAREA
mmetsp:Transcript_969/g.2777  ORF Transcript_969/g.2777 Transcript_969/m.2777 type:complete len:167 (-) Transcript_969:37-537(-)